MHPIVKYTVFISSTFDDLKAEREQVADAILKLGHIPCGMEQFSTGAGRGWNIITQTIDICDYYVILVAGRYGTLFPGEQLSWTEKEYGYARSRGLRPLVFLRNKDYIIGSHMDNKSSAITRRQAFLKRISDECLHDIWTNGDNLCTLVTTALTKQIDADKRLGRPRPGWFRGDDIPGNSQVTSELTRISAENAWLNAFLGRVQELFKPNLEIRTPQDAILPEKLELELLDYTDDCAEGPERLLRGWLSRLFWLPLRITNLGPAPAREIHVYVSASQSYFLAEEYVNEYELMNIKNSLGLAIALKAIPSLGVKRPYDLPVLAFAAKDDVAKCPTVIVKVGINDELGTTVERQLEIHLKKGPKWHGDWMDALNHANLKRNVWQDGPAST